MRDLTKKELVFMKHYIGVLDYSLENILNSDEDEQGYKTILNIKSMIELMPYSRHEIAGFLSSLGRQLVIQNDLTSCPKNFSIWDINDFKMWV